jgi:hypothetical protein
MSANNHVNRIEGYVLCARVFQGAKRNKQCYDSDGLNSFASEAIEGLCRLFELLLVTTHFFEG